MNIIHMSDTTCPWCGEKERAELVEVYADGTFQIETCCEGMHEALIDWSQAEDWKRFLDQAGLPGITGHKTRRVVDADGQLLIDYQLRITAVSQKEAKEFVRRHHAHSPNPPAGWKYGAAIWNGYTKLGVVMVGRPVARAIDQTKTVEINRLCLRRDIDSQLAWNACSQLYGWAAREARKRKYSRIITYTLAREPGTSLRAAGFAPEHRSPGGSWNCPSRPRVDKHSTEPKIRWGRNL